jgi:hypothetical protein
MKIPSESNKVPTRYEAHFLTLYLLANKPLPEGQAGTVSEELSKLQHFRSPPP